MMPNTRKATQKAKKKDETLQGGSRSKVAKETMAVSKTNSTKQTDGDEETATERLLRKVQNKRKSEEEAKACKGATATARKKKKSADEDAEAVGPPASARNEEVSTRFMKDDNFVDMGVSSDLRKEFPSQFISINVC